MFWGRGGGEITYIHTYPFSGVRLKNAATLNSDKKCAQVSKVWETLTS